MRSMGLKLGADIIEILLREILGALFESVDSEDDGAALLTSFGKEYDAVVVEIEGGVTPELIGLDEGADESVLGGDVSLDEIFAVSFADDVVDVVVVEVARVKDSMLPDWKWMSKRMMLAPRR